MKKESIKKNKKLKKNDQLKKIKKNDHLKN